ncbi:MAG: polysaccharide deacetylase family protein [Symploca sp. SIO1B1]|nr:polysaccharide deacetylase family protein [Symploca sp. SIO2D2]NER21928.1 polysaccharide deacetylase family protein [Symploca sp. SIO1C2]NER96984.1 polysaccharide deacetylase family protein [Symploca sp. SIO1B1]
MANHHLFVWRRSISIVAAAALGFVAGFSLTVDKSFSQRAVQTIALPLGGLSQNTADLPATTAQSNAQFKQLVANLMQAEKVARLNPPVPAQFKGKTVNDIPMNTGEKVIALTFDDGPWPKSTNEILYILNQNKIKATFFFIGRNVQTFPHLAKLVAEHGHAVGNHSWSHPYHQHTPTAAAQQIDRTTELIYKLTGIKTNMFRPPGGHLKNGLVAYAHSKNYVNVMWSADSRDYAVSSPTLLRNVLNQSSPGGIVLMHDGGGNRMGTVYALPEMISQLKKQGYKFVTVPELMEMREKELQANQG